MHEKLQADEYQQYAYAYLQISEAVSYSCKEEEHGAETEDGEDVREEHHLRVGGHREYGRNTVESEDKVAELNEYDSHEQRSDKPFATI